MIAVLPHDVPEDLLAEVLQELERRGARCQVSRGSEQTVLALDESVAAEDLEVLLAGRAEADLIPILKGRQYRRGRAWRSFMTGMIRALGFLLALVALIPIFGFLRPPATPLVAPRMVRVATTGRVPEESAHLIRTLDQPTLLVHRRGGHYFALDATCSYISLCQLAWDGEQGLIVCPCHGCSFDVYGNVVRGPASVPLPTHEVMVIDDAVFVRREG